jgi:hypothetical protein
LSCYLRVESLPYSLFHSIPLLPSEMPPPRSFSGNIDQFFILSVLPRSYHFSDLIWSYHFP